MEDISHSAAACAQIEDLSLLLATCSRVTDTESLFQPATPKPSLEEGSARLTARAHQLEVRSYCKKMRLKKFVDSRPDLLDALLSHCDKLTSNRGAEGAHSDLVTPEKRTGYSVRSSSSPSLIGDGEYPTSSTATSWNGKPAQSLAAPGV